MVIQGVVMDFTLKFQNEDGIICDDLLHSEKTIKEFHSIISNSNYSVYAVSGGWGTGKTCFVKMWENTLKEYQQAFVHIDAFKMDYETEPFIMLIKAFRDYMIENAIDKNKIEGFLGKAKKVFSIKNIAKLGFNILVDKTIGVEPAKEFISNAYDTCFEELTAEESLYDDLQSSLEKIIKQDKPLYIIIDELDRCRPDFALETLERIKHIFHVKNVKYILVYNEKIMKSIINKKYGLDINADKYLHKFVQKTYFLDNTRRIKQWFINEIDNPKERFASSIMPEFLKTYCGTIFSLAKMYGLKLRDLQQFLNDLKQYAPNDYSDLFMMMVFIELLKQIDKNEYDTIFRYYNENKNISTSEPSLNVLPVIFSSFKGQIKNLTEDINQAFCLYMDYREHQS
jgi:hypothetical protein